MCFRRSESDIFANAGLLLFGIQKIQVMGPQNHLYLLITRNNQKPRGWRTEAACNPKIENEGGKQKSVLCLSIKYEYFLFSCLN